MLPKGVENVHTLCACMPESDDRSNNIYISVKRFERAFGPEKCYIRTSYYYYYVNSESFAIFVFVYYRQDDDISSTTSLCRAPRRPRHG